MSSKTTDVRPNFGLIVAGRKGEREDCASRDTWVASVYWEEWENGVRDHIDALMARKQ